MSIVLKLSKEHWVNGKHHICQESSQSMETFSNFVHDLTTHMTNALCPRPDPKQLFIDACTWLWHGYFFHTFHLSAFLIDCLRYHGAIAPLIYTLKYRLSKALVHARYVVVDSSTLLWLVITCTVLSWVNVLGGAPATWQSSRTEISLQQLRCF